MKTELVKLNDVIYECSLHLKRLKSANEELEDFIPLDITKFQNLNDEEIRILDQLIYRFTKLQDAMGRDYSDICLLLLKRMLKHYPFLIF
jgi:hypothetical protein